MDASFMISVTPDAIMYLLDEELCILIHTDGKGAVQIATSKKEPESMSGWSLKEQDGIRIFIQDKVSFPAEKSLHLDVKKRMFFTTLKASVQSIPKGAGFMGTRGCT